MNNLMLLVVLGVAFVYCGGSNVPAVLRNNKQLLGGVVVGLFLCSFFGMRLEGVKNSDGGNYRGPCPKERADVKDVIDAGAADEEVDYFVSQFTQCLRRQKPNTDIRKMDYANK